MERFGSILKCARLAQGLTLDELGKRAGVHRGYLSGIENGKVRPPSPRVIMKLASACKLDKNQMLLSAFVDKAPDVIRPELMRRVFAKNATPARESKKLVTLKEKINRLHRLVDELASDVLSHH